MSDRRVPRYDTYAAGTALDDYSAELPRLVAAPPSSGFAVPRDRGEIAGAATADCRLPTAGKTVSSQGADRARPAAPSRGSASDGAAFSFDDISDAAALNPPARREEAGAMPPVPASALSERSRLLALLVAERGGIAVGEVIERAVVHYADHIIGIATLARPMVLPRAAGGPKDGRDTRLAPEGDHAQHGGGGAAPLGPSGHSPRERGGDHRRRRFGRPTDDCRLPFSKGGAPP